MKLDPRKVPESLLPLVPVAEKWGIPDDGHRGDVVESASTEELQVLIHCFDGVSDGALEEWLTGPEARPDPTEEYVAISALLWAVDLAKLVLAERYDADGSK